MQRLSIVIPCFNEAPGIPYLCSRLAPALADLRRSFEVEVVLVDDGSRDGTRERLQAAFGARDDVRIVVHPENRGIAAAVATGVGEARGDIVCTLDADCTYDPMLLGDLASAVAAGADVATASPYHPRGAVANAPGWRLVLSRAASVLYRAATGSSLYTWTSCCRAWRAPVARGLTVRDGGFPGVAEMLVAAVLAGARVAEVPARLERRRFGESKMKVARAVAGHLRVLARALAARRSRARQAGARGRD